MIYVGGEKLKVNLNKSKALVFERDGRRQCEISFPGEELQVVDEFIYSVVKSSEDGFGEF